MSVLIDTSSAATLASHNRAASNRLLPRCACSAKPRRRRFAPPLDLHGSDFRTG
jgi:hypothetical protein